MFSFLFCVYIFLCLVTEMNGNHICSLSKCEQHVPHFSPCSPPKRPKSLQDASANRLQHSVNNGTFQSRGAAEKQSKRNGDHTHNPLPFRPPNTLPKYHHHHQRECSTNVWLPRAFRVNIYIGEATLEIGCPPERGGGGDGLLPNIPSCTLGRPALSHS